MESQACPNRSETFRPNLSASTFNGFAALAILLASASVACSQSTNPSTKDSAPEASSDIGIPADALSDSYATDASGSCDMSQIPGVYLQVYVDHLSTGHTPAKVLQMIVFSHITPIDQAIIAAKESFVLETWPAKSKIPGSWSVKDIYSGKPTLSFKPDSLLNKDADYLITILENGVTDPARRHILFRVGSLLRVRNMTFLKAKLQDVIQFGVLFSEPIDTAKLPSKISVSLAQSPTQSLPIQLTEAGTHGALFQVQGPKLTDQITITIQSDLGANGSLLDGNYDGIPNTEPFQTTLTPANHLDDFWEPSLDF